MGRRSLDVDHWTSIMGRRVMTTSKHPTSRITSLLEQLSGLHESFLDQRPNGLF